LLFIGQWLSLWQQASALARRRRCWGWGKLMDIQAFEAAAQPTRAFGAKGIFATVLGNGFEFFDFGVYAIYIGIIGQTFYPADNPFVSDLSAAATFGVGFIARPLGGIVIGAYGDRAGRKPAMVLTICLMALGSGMIAFLPGYATIGVAAPILLILSRLVQGFALGGEMGPSTMFMLESAPAGRRMFYASWQLASQNLSSLLMGLIGFALASGLTAQGLKDWGWRIPFALGILIAPVGIYIRSRLDETLQHGQAGPSDKGSVISTVLKDYWSSVIIGVALVAGGTITQYFLVNMTPYAIRTLHLDQSTAMLGSISLGLTGALGALAGGILADRYGVKTIVIVPRILLLLSLFPTMKFLVASPSATTLVLMIAILSLMQGISSAVAIVLIPLSFPRAVRSTGLAFTYALGVAIFGGTATYIVTWLVGVTADPLASVYYVFVANFGMLAAIFCAFKHLNDDSVAEKPST
jgi:MFS family permease